YPGAHGRGRRVGESRLGPAPGGARAEDGVRAQVPEVLPGPLRAGLSEQKKLYVLLGQRRDCRYSRRSAASWAVRSCRRKSGIIDLDCVARRWIDDFGIARSFRSASRRTSSRASSRTTSPAWIAPPVVSTSAVANFGSI